MVDSNNIKENKTVKDKELNDPVKFSIGEVVKHRYYSFYGVIFDVDPEFMNTEEWYQSIPTDIRPKRNQPFYHLFAENDDGPYIAYVSQQNLVPSEHIGPCTHPQIESIFDGPNEGKYTLKNSNLH
tara:strand:- start:36 stop:413 length:378 start_codon:yes stop_codon:yes gene_type:complete